jgi:2-methylcitrate dehydratase PrpD
VRHDAGLDADYPTAWPHRITVRLHGGRELYVNSEHPPGSPQVRMHDDEVKGQLLELCAARLGSARAPIIRDAVAQLEHTHNIRTFSALLQSA